jgi:hypothetical protein
LVRTRGKREKEGDPWLAIITQSTTNGIEWTAIGWYLTKQKEKEKNKTWLTLMERSNLCDSEASEWAATTDSMTEGSNPETWRKWAVQCVIEEYNSTSHQRKRKNSVQLL